MVPISCRNEKHALTEVTEMLYTLIFLVVHIHQLKDNSTVLVGDIWKITQWKANVHKGDWGVLQFYLNKGRGSTGTNADGVLFSRGFRRRSFLLSQIPGCMLPSSFSHWLWYEEGRAFPNRLTTYPPWSCHFTPKFRSSGLSSTCLFQKLGYLGWVANLLEVSRDFKSHFKDINTHTLTHRMDLWRH